MDIPTRIVSGKSSSHFEFPRWSNYLLPALINVAILFGVYLPILLALGLSPWTTAVGYSPAQPIPFSHRMHAMELGMDCRYCHSTVETDAYAAIPSTQICMNCHASIKAESPLLVAMREAYTGGAPLQWTKVHDLADFAYFNHSAHVNKGVGCTTCHGTIGAMDVVTQRQPLTMAWCLNCHRQPEANLRPRDQITNLNWSPHLLTGKTQSELGAALAKEYGVRDAEALTSCSTCHR